MCVVLEIYDQYNELVNKLQLNYINNFHIIINKYNHHVETISRLSYQDFFTGDLSRISQGVVSRKYFQQSGGLP